MNTKKKGWPEKAGSLLLVMALILSGLFTNVPSAAAETPGSGGQRPFVPGEVIIAFHPESEIEVQSLVETFVNIQT